MAFASGYFDYDRFCEGDLDDWFVRISYSETEAMVEFYFEEADIELVRDIEGEKDLEAGSMLFKLENIDFDGDMRNFSVLVKDYGNIAYFFDSPVDDENGYDTKYYDVVADDCQDF